MTGLSLLLAILLMWKVYPGSIEQETNAKSELSILSVNLLSSNTDAQKVNQYIRDIDADVLLLIEYTAFWDRHAALEEYPYSITRPREDNFGIALYSKIPLHDEEIIDFTQSRFPMTTAILDINGEQLRILGLHYENPVGARQTKVQRFQIQEMISFANQFDHFIAIGDFNLTPYSKGFENIIQNTSLQDSRKGFGIQGSWPNVASIFRIPIDHALVSEHIQVTQREIGQPVGSDHLPLYLQLRIDTE